MSRAVKFEAQHCTDETNQKVAYICITCMREYQDKSLEELRFEDYLANRKRPQQVKEELWNFESINNTKCQPFGSTNSNVTGNTKPFGYTENSSFFVKPGLPETVNNSPIRNTNSASSTGRINLNKIFGPKKSSPLFDNTSNFGCIDRKPDFGKTNIFGSTESIFGSLFDNSSNFGSTDRKSGCRKPSKSDYSWNTSKSDHCNTNKSDCWNTSKSDYGNTSKSDCGNTSKSDCGNTSIFGSIESKPPFGHTNNVISMESMLPFGNTSIFGTTESKPAIWNTNSFGFAERKPCFGNTNTFTAVAQTLSQTQFSTFKTSSGPRKIATTTGSKLLGTVASTSNSSPKTTSNLSSSTVSARRVKKLTSSKAKNSFTQTADIASPASCTTKTSDNAQEVVLLGGSEKFNFSLRNSKTSDSDPENREEEIKKLVSDLHGLIECPVCFGSLGPSLKQCENGHGICESCFINVEKCPTCQHAYLPNKPILLLQILDRMPKLCSFSDKGCDQIFLNQKEEHETYCKFRPTSCKFQSCEWKGTVETVTDHVRTCAKNTENTLCEMYFPNVKIVQTYVFDKTQDVLLYSAIIFENQLFWKCFCRDTSSKNISYKFYHIAPARPKKKYYLVVSFNKGEIEFKMCIAASYVTDILSEDKKGNEISFHLPDEDLERFYDAEAKGYRYTQQIIAEDI